MLKTRTALALAFLAGSLILAACGAAPAARQQPTEEPTAGAVAPSPAPNTDSQETQMPSSDLAGTKWTLTELDGAAPNANGVPTLEFEADRAAGKGSCNNYFGGYTVDGATIAFEGFGSTMMACEPELMEQEQAYLDLLTRAASFAVDGDTLTITADDGATLVFARAA